MTKEKRGKEMKKKCNRLRPKPKPKPNPVMTDPCAKICIECRHELIIRKTGFLKKTKKHICMNNYCSRYGFETFVFKNWGHFDIK